MRQHTPGDKPDPHAVSCDQGWQFYLKLLETSTRLEATNAQLQTTVAELQTALRKVAVLERMKNQLSRFVPATVRKFIEANPEGVESDKQERDVTVLFLDIGEALCEGHRSGGTSVSRSVAGGR